ncbi:hypothetical protein [Streptomyces aureus]
MRDLAKELAVWETPARRTSSGHACLAAAGRVPRSSMVWKAATDRGEVALMAHTAEAGA